MLEKPKSYRSEKHLAWVRQKPCCVCGTNQGIEAHHLIGLGHGAMAMRMNDAMTVPVCRPCHQKFHEKNTINDQLYYFARLVSNAFDSGMFQFNQNKK